MIILRYSDSEGQVHTLRGVAQEVYERFSDLGFWEQGLEIISIEDVEVWE